MLKPYFYCFTHKQDIRADEQDLHLGCEVQDMSNDYFEAFENQAEANGEWSGL